MRAVIPLIKDRVKNFFLTSRLANNMSFMTLSITIPLIVVVADTTRLSLIQTQKDSHTHELAFQHFWTEVCRIPDLRFWHARTHKNHGHTPSDTHSTFPISQKTGDPYNYTWSLLAWLQWGTGDKCSGETETSRSDCWNSQRVKAEQREKPACRERWAELEGSSLTDSCCVQEAMYGL